MVEMKKVCQVLFDLIEVQQLQAKQIEKLITHIERHTDTLNYPQEMPLVVSQLSELHTRISALRQRSDEVGVQDDEN